MCKLAKEKKNVGLVSWIVVGCLAGVLGRTGAAGFNLWSIPVAALGRPRCCFYTA